MESSKRRRKYPQPSALWVSNDIVRSLLAATVPRLVDTFELAQSSDSLIYACVINGAQVEVNASLGKNSDWIVVVWVEPTEAAIEQGIAIGKALLDGGGRLVDDDDEFFPGLIAPPLTLRAKLVAATVIVAFAAVVVLLLAQL